MNISFSYFVNSRLQAHPSFTANKVDRRRYQTFMGKNRQIQKQDYRGTNIRQSLTVKMGT